MLTTGFARRRRLLSLRRGGLKAGLTLLFLLVGAGSVHDAAALNETRTLSFHHTHSEEDLTVTFKRDGRYDEEALLRLNHFLRDWRTQDETVMDRHLFDILWEVYRDVGAKQPIQIVSAYRSPATNAMLRHRSAHSGVARNSQHMLGHAMDFYIPGVPLEQIRNAGLRLQRGGVGFYPTSGSPFVHLDTGNIRYWPRMTHEELVKVFPDGRTVHIPSDGTPLKGYDLARADIERRGDGGDKPSFLTALFGSKSTHEDEDEAGAPGAGRKPAAPVAATARPAEPIPVPAPRPRSQIASRLALTAADSQAVQVAPQSQPAAGEPSHPRPATGNAQTPADVINARSYDRDDDGAAAPQATSARLITTIRTRSANAAMQPAQGAAPAPPSADRAGPLGATAPGPRRSPLLAQARDTATAGGIGSVAIKGTQGGSGLISNSARIAAVKGGSAWLRIMMLVPSVGSSMSVTMLGDADLTRMSRFFEKPEATINTSFTDDPTRGVSYDHFSGSATAKPDSAAFMLHAADLH